MSTVFRSIACLAAMAALGAVHVSAEEQEAAQEEKEAHALVINEGVEPGTFTQDYDAAMAYAAEHRLPVFMNFTGSDWCGWCKLMDKNVFSKSAWSDFAKENLVMVWLDFPRDKSLVPDAYKDRNDKLRGEYGVRGYPTYFVLDCDGRQLGRLGAGRDKTPDSFNQEVAGLLKKSSASIEKRCATFTEADAASVRAQMAALRGAQEAQAEAKSKAAALREQAEELDEAATEKVDEAQAAFDAAMETAKVNIMTPEQKAAFDTAKASLAAAEQAMEEWSEGNEGKRPTQEMRKKARELMKAIADAEEKVANF